MRTKPTPGGMTRRTALAGIGATLLASCTKSGPTGSGDPAPILQTGPGKFRGAREDGVVRFLGIPYAQGIAGSNRFAPPRPVEPWADTRDALQLPPSSPQQTREFESPVTPAFRPPDYVVPGDDCLALNVWAPDTEGGGHPVMVWLHGGGWVSGSGSSPVFDGTRLASRGDVVVVTINHRLALSGFTDFSRIVGGDFADSANLGIRDIVAALEWVRDNIAAVGGDPDTVTIFGESGGGWKVTTLLGTPSAKGLFHRAIVQSGPLTRFLEPAEADEMAHTVLAELGLTPATAGALHDLSLDEIIAAEGRVLANQSMGVPGFPTGFWPVIDGDIIRTHAFDPVAAPSSLDVPLLIGQTGTEFTLLSLRDQAAYSLDDAGLETRVVQTFGDDAAPVILASYRRDFPDYDPSGLWFRLFSDYAMAVLSLTIADARVVPGSTPVYTYRFDWQTPIANGMLRSPHTIEIPFVFDNANGTGEVMTGGGPEVADLAKTVSSAWVEFARSGTPAAPGLPEWPRYTTARRESMHLDTNSRVAPYMDPELVPVFREKLFRDAGLA